MSPEPRTQELLSYDHETGVRLAAWIIITRIMSVFTLLLLLILLLVLLLLLLLIRLLLLLLLLLLPRRQPHWPEAVQSEKLQSPGQNTPKLLTRAAVTRALRIRAVVH